MKYFLFIIALLICSESGAAHIGSVAIKRIRLFDTVALVETNEPINKAACATVDTYFVIPLDETHASNRRLSVLLSAQAQGKLFDPNCTATCDQTWSGWLGNVTVCNEVSIQ